MISRDYPIGYGVGKFLIDKNDVIRFFEKYNNRDNCNERCPFVGECDKVMESSNDEITLCGILGIQEDE